MSEWTSRMIANLAIDLAKEYRDETWKRVAERMRDFGVPTWSQLREAERRARGAS